MAKEYLLSSVHVHTKLCDGKNTPEELALSAWKAGLKTLGVVDADTWESLRLAAQGLCRECQEG